MSVAKEVEENGAAQPEWQTLNTRGVIAFVTWPTIGCAEAPGGRGYGLGVE
jgi:hypothetical protein